MQVHWSLEQCALYLQNIQAVTSQIYAFHLDNLINLVSYFYFSNKITWKHWKHLVPQNFLGMKKTRERETVVHYLEVFQEETNRRVLTCGVKFMRGGDWRLVAFGLFVWGMVLAENTSCPVHTHKQGKTGHHHRHIMLFLSRSTQKLDRKFGSTYKRSHSCPLSKNRPRESRQNISDLHNANYCSLWIRQLQRAIVMMAQDGCVVIH